MVGLHVLLCLWAYFILTCAFPLDGGSQFPTHSFGPKNLSKSRTIVSDDKAADFLTLLSAPFDVNNPNPVDNGYIRDDSDGEGTTIFVLDSGFNLEKYPDEQCLDQRRIDTFVLDQKIRTGGPLTQEQINNGDYFPPPDSMDDIADLYGDGQYHGHGTPIAIIAAGCKTGVARKANLYLIKLGEVIMRSGVPRAEVTSAWDLLYGFHHISSVLSGSRGLSIPRGKAVVMISINVAHKLDLMQRFTEQEYNELEYDYKMVLDSLDRQGATVIMAAGNGGKELPIPSFVDDAFPQHLATQDSPYIIVGSTNNKGQLSDFSTPGRGKTPVTVYAQGEDVASYDLVHGTTPWYRRGTSFSTPIVAGLAAYTLGLPSNSHLCPYRENPAPGQDSVGTCMKKYLARTAFQRVESNNLLAQDPSQYKYDIPERVLVVSNGATKPTEEGDEDNGGDPTPCWSPDTWNECKIANVTEM